MLQRLGIYLKEMFPIGVYVPFAFLNHYVLFFAIQLFIGTNTPIISLYSLVGVATMLGFMLIMRVFDELKDEEVDARLFPHRPYPRGAVKKRDLIVMAVAVFGVVVAFNLYRSYTLPFFLWSVFYGFLTYKWFFLRRTIQNNLLLALFSHQPLTLIVNMYVASTAMVQVNQFGWDANILLAMITFFLPVFAWEISRKIKAKNTENDYVTYSKILGPRIAAGSCYVVLFSFSVLLIWLGIQFGFSTWHFWLQLLPLGYIMFIFGRFILTPISAHNQLKTTTELWPAVASLVFLIGIMVSKGIAFQVGVTPL